MPALDGGDDPVWVGGPDERLGIGILLGDEAVDGGLKIDERVERSPLQAPSGELGEEPLDCVEPRASPHCPDPISHRITPRMVESSSTPYAARRRQKASLDQRLSCRFRGVRQVI